MSHILTLVPSLDRDEFPFASTRGTHHLTDQHVAYGKAHWDSSFRKAPWHVAKVHFFINRVFHNLIGPCRLLLQHLDINPPPRNFRRCRMPVLVKTDLESKEFCSLYGTLVFVHTVGSYLRGIVAPEQGRCLCSGHYRSNLYRQKLKPRIVSGTDDVWYAHVGCA